MSEATRYAVIGDPVAHSLSPTLHNGWMSDLGINERYEAICVPSEISTLEAFRDVLDGLAGREYRGLNVTMPHKVLAFQVADEADALSTRIEAANTLTKTRNGWSATNTDGAGFDCLLDLAGCALDEVVLLGAGGAARAVAMVLARRAKSLTVLNRTVSRAQDLVRLLGSIDAQAGPLSALRTRLGANTLIVNTLPVGYGGGDLDLPSGNGRTLIDISYGTAAEIVLAPARDKGWLTFDGLPMLVGQAQKSFETWFGEVPDFGFGMTRAKARLEGKPS